MGDSIANPELQALIVSLEAQRVALLVSMDLHIRRSEELALQVNTIDQEIQEAHNRGD